MPAVGAREGTLRSADGTRLFWRSWEVESPRATFAVLHGLGEHSGRYRRFAEGMAARGFSTFAVDLRGMGRSEGRRGHIASWSDWIKDAETFIGHVEAHPSAGEVIPVGHSFGGVLLLSAVIEDAVTPRRFIASNPALRTKVRVPGWKLALGRLASRLVPTLALSNEVSADMISRDPESVREYRLDPLIHDRITSRLFTEWRAAADGVLARSGELRTPFLLLVSEADRLIDPAGSRELADRAVNTPHEMKVYPGRYHEPFNDLDANEVFDDIAAWAARDATSPARS